MKTPTFSDGFRCLHCQAFISAEIPLAGVRNRNHCPYCLWSRHLDWRTPGDRLSACKSAMRPIGLTLKRIHKKYEGAQAGELMVIHQCVECRCISINRIAADDGSEVLVDVFLASQETDRRIKTDLEERGIQMLDRAEWETISRRLFGTVLPFGVGAPTGLEWQST
jgi:hypothetical protein